MNGEQFNGYGQALQACGEWSNVIGYSQGQPMLGQVTSGHTISNPQHTHVDYMLALQQVHEKKMLSGNKPVVVCGGEIKEAKDMNDAQAIAESLAHSKSADAYILKPVKKVAPKRDVVTTDL